jgi:uncharacterized protein (DUF1697 family)
MPTYIALLRGINLGGHKKIKMEQLRASLEEMGLKRVNTYIQSGNIVFQTGKAAPATLCKKIEAIIMNDFGHSVSVIVRTAEELEAAITNNPLLQEPDIDPEKLHVMFLSEVPASSALEKLQSVTAAPDRFRAVGKELHFYLPNGVAESVLMKKPVDRILTVVTTTRNWRTVNALRQMCRDCQ